MIQEVSAYGFETESLIGEIRWALPKPGIVYLCHKGQPRPEHKPGYDLLPEVPRQALLNPEWFKIRGIEDGGVFRGKAWVPAEGRVQDGSIVFYIPAGRTGEWNVEVEIRYSPGPDWVDLRVTLTPKVTWSNFDFFFASYIIEGMESTWVSAQIEGREEWRRLGSPRAEPWGPLYAVVSGENYRRLLFDGRYESFTSRVPSMLQMEPFDYCRPIIVAHKADSGLACIIMVEPTVCRMLCMQRHTYETARDFTISGDLIPGSALTGRARLVVRNIGQFPEARDALDHAWEEFCNDLRRDGSSRERRT